jgi:hypothetical protein
MEDQITITTKLEIINNVIPNYVKNTYVITDKFKKPRVTVALVQYGNILVRGIAICCKKDRINVQLGIIKAEGRAIKAIAQKKSTLPINRNEAIRTLFETNSTPFKFKSEFDVTITEYEKTLSGFNNAD